ncbi:MAG: type IV secretory system conjugative DNA transfer family protein, partial [Ethanoligenens sp.]
MSTFSFVAVWELVPVFGSFGLLLHACLHNPYWFMSILASPLIGLLFWYVFLDHHSVDVSRKRAGNGQYGYARFMTPKEKDEAYRLVPRGKEMTPVVVVEYNKARWRVNTSDQSMLMVSPPGGGKTTSEYEPTIRYNAEVCRNNPDAAVSMIVTDVKGQLLSDMGEDVKQAGYAVYSLNFRYPLFSYQYNLMNNVNVHMNQYKAAPNKEEQILEQAKAEKFAKLLASSIVKNTGVSAASNSESSEYFNQTSEGLMTAIILLVSEYGRGSERHIVSVFRMIIELNGLSEGSSEALQKNRMEQLFDVLPENHRAKLFAGASTKADVRTSMNIFSSALGKLVSFIDAELEQMICEHSLELNTEDFIKRPTVIFLIMPDEDPTKHFFASLFIRNMMNELIAIAERQHGEHVLPRRIINLWDEFGQIPPVKDFATLVTAARSRGIRFLTALQSLGQLEDKYSQAQAKIIRQAFQMTMFSYQSPNALDTA